jgi:hypothetical protein
MTARHLLIALFSGLIVYLLLILLQGPFSYQRLRGLEEYRADLIENLAELEVVGESLEARYYELRDDPQAIVREANRIGMTFPQERMLQPEGRQRTVEGISPGQLLSLQVPGRVNLQAFRAAAISAGLIVLVLLVIFDPPTDRNRRSDRTETRRKTASSPVSPLSSTFGSVGSDVEMGQSMRVQVASRE